MYSNGTHCDSCGARLRTDEERESFLDFLKPYTAEADEDETVWTCPACGAENQANPASSQEWIRCGECHRQVKASLVTTQ
jgi:predicted RNA-binding Zn-ribbon protein involved in translation (DUF1610 family)